MEKVKKILITGGGSGGHISVASGLIEGIKKKDFEIYKNLIYVGGDLGMVGEDYGNSLEQKKFEDAEFKCRYIRAGKLQRKLSITSIKLFFRTILGLIDSFKIINEEKPNLIFSTGGFVTVPICIAGWLKKIPVYLHEQTATVGLSNKIVGKFAKKIYIAFDSSKRYFKKDKIELVGDIVREAITNFDIERVDPTIKDLVENYDKSPLIYISGGGLGSHKINKKIFEDLSKLLSEYKIILQTGDNQEYKDFDKAVELKKTLSSQLQERFLPIKFLNDDNIGYVYKNANFFIGRAGANTVYEIAVLEKPSIFIPIPWVTNNEQYENAKVLVDIGLSIILEENSLDNTNLLDLIKESIKSLPKPDMNISELKTKFPINAVEKILNDIFKNENI
ncbi:MAG: UDP-N-acetylglucosamine--N-acetylmuramyl-(pentapeptide) pyrophosphoryl-undecaprenol N-acetylglucosamine transferase [Candidatus Dojkabacteria bacterium]|nr:UDP-N-acetylglucosamine--N-acetylmuramyl-(pentapeptide) pyrophosphoryl-undecaprenol N-acetylglucosamine transferase [Candidatus Dojkabacteria bacterium]